MAEEQVDDDDVFDAPAAKAPSVLAAVTQDDAEGDEVEPIAVPKKTVVTTKKVVKVVKK